MSVRDFKSISRAMGANRPPQVPLIAVDRFNNMIEPGHLVLYHNVADLVFEVVSVAPVLNPGIQGGQAVNITLRAQFPVGVVPAQANQYFAICGATNAKRAEIAARNGQPAVPQAVEVPADEQGGAADAADEAPADPEPTHQTGICPACETKGEVGKICTVCGDAVYRPIPAEAQ